MEYLLLDVSEIQQALGEGKFDPESYDVIIDKGCLDCVVCNEDSTKAM